MPFFNVMCFVGGIWDDKPARKVEADDELHAAVKVCGGPLVEGAPKLGDPRAEVRPLDNPKNVTLFRAGEK